MLSKEFIGALKVINNKFSDIEWFIIGKTSRLLQGENVIPARISIILNYRDIEEVLDVLSIFERSEVIELSNGEAVEFTVKINGVDVRIYAEFADSTFFINNKTPLFVSESDLTIPCVSINDLNVIDKLLGF